MKQITYQPTIAAPSVHTLFYALIVIALIGLGILWLWLGIQAAFVLSGQIELLTDVSATLTNIQYGLI